MIDDKRRVAVLTRNGQLRWRSETVREPWTITWLSEEHIAVLRGGDTTYLDVLKIGGPWTNIAVLRPTFSMGYSRDSI